RSRDAGLRVAARVEAPGHPHLGTDVGTLASGAPLGVALSEDLGRVLRAEHVVLDFTGAPDATVRHAALAVERGAALVVGTTGFDARQREELDALATRTRSVVGAHFSVGVTVLTALVTLAARLLDHSFESEIVELHHHGKKDAPSGTALAL